MVVEQHYTFPVFFQLNKFFQLKIVYFHEVSSVRISRAQLTPSDTINQCLLYFFLESRFKKCRFPVAVFLSSLMGMILAPLEILGTFNLKKEQER